MSESAQSRALVPAERLSALASQTWIDATQDGLVAFLLLSPAAGAEGGGDVANLAAALGLAGPGESMPSLGERVVLRGRAATVQLPEIGRALRVAADAEWSRLVRDGGTVVLLLAATPLAPDASKQARDAHLLQAVADDRLWLGKAVRIGWSGTTWVRCGCCVRCVSGTGRTAVPGAPDCYGLWLDAATEGGAQ